MGQSGASNLRRIYAANEVAEINRLLGKPLTDAKALGLIKNLLLDRVHTHLAKTMETNQLPDSGQSETPGNNGEKKNCYYLLINNFGSKKGFNFEWHTVYLWNISIL